MAAILLATDITPPSQITGHLFLCWPKMPKLDKAIIHSRGQGQQLVLSDQVCTWNLPCGHSRQCFRLNHEPVSGSCLLVASVQEVWDSQLLQTVQVTV